MNENLESENSSRLSYPMSIDTIIGVEDGIDEATTPMGMIKSAPLGIFFLLFFSAISAIFIKRNPPVSDRIN